MVKSEARNGDWEGRRKGRMGIVTIPEVKRMAGKVRLAGEVRMDWKVEDK